ncbi:response regulator [Sideroxydans lithotrophicus]|uniref:Two component transcriptional regulator, LuxR family n=1 Tax=Sideroxydans lithotrophicus (strain ES-1) TaxID=580332 RepID=D5CS90_SIDLE|nr:response regulator transcription factor [Sideroxydans lithotrophicus]ADE11826.1 two component transcriptional regulator, LuxR family [Sideroxydans lithotrophicus ES-1]
MIRVFIADDHAIVREGLKQLFTLSGISMAGEATNGAQLLESLRKVQVDLLLLDMTMPGISGVELIERIRAQDPQLPILVLSMHNEPQIARRALIAGAAGYCTKDSDPEVLIEAIRKVASGGRFIAPSLAEKMAFDTGQHAQYLPREVLSEREYTILHLLVQGKSVNEVAAELVISNKTVSTHKARLMQKLNLQNNAELIRYGVEHGLV